MYMYDNKSICQPLNVLLVHYDCLTCISNVIPLHFLFCIMIKCMMLRIVPNAYCIGVRWSSELMAGCYGEQ